MQKTILVFKTSVRFKNDIRKLKPMLDNLINEYGRWSFDLEDCDKILRIETQSPNSVIISSILEHNGFYCEEL